MIVAYAHELGPRLSSLSAKLAQQIMAGTQVIFRPGGIRLPRRSPELAGHSRAAFNG